MATTERADRKQRREWYSVSVTSVAMVAALVLVAAGLIVVPRLGLESVEQQAERVINQASERIAVIEKREDIEQIKVEHRAAWDLFNEATAAFDDQQFERALESGDRCLLVLESIERKGEGTIRVLTAEGGVEYRRGERGTWRRLRNHVNLNPGDWVKTATDGTAELLFSVDGSLFTLRQSTMVHLGGELGSGDRDGATNINFGSVELNTSTRDHTLTTPQSEAKVSQNSEALVAFDRDRQSGRFAAFTGGVEVKSLATGQKLEIGALQQVEQLGERLAEVSNLPGRPELSGPPDDRAVDLAVEGEIVLSWEPVEDARRYALRISGNRLFASHFIENTRAKSSARVGVERDGQYFWRVAAMDPQGNLGPWSDVRSFRATSASRVQQVSDNEPPPLEVNVETIGTFVIVNGKTELGATVTINGEPVVLKSDGSFRATIQMDQAGWSVLEVVATDAWNNSTPKKRRVFIDAV
jgi:hypothetical protein